ncbi:MAG: hypothetical protein MR852_03810 [Treponema sp.]|nr:hypothetical protein [Treponema sp.]
MKQDEREIENLAQDYFKDNARSKEKRDALLTAIYKNKEFVVKIVAGALKKYPNILNKDELQDLKHVAVLNTFEQAENNYNPVNGNFVKYFSVNLSYNTISILKHESKKKSETTLDASMGDEEDSDSFVNNLADKRECENDAFVVKEQSKQILKIFNSIDKFFLSTKAGQQNKSAVYTYFVLEYLLMLSDAQCSKFIETYEFLKPQKDTIELLKKEFAKSRKVPNKKDFAKICGTAATKFSGLSLKMEVFVKSDVANGEN